MPKDFEIILY